MNQGPSAGMNCFEQPGMYSQPSERMLPSGRIVPPETEALPDVPPYPSLQSEDRFLNVGYAEIFPPAPQVATPDVSQLRAGSTLMTPPDLLYLRFEKRDTLRRYPDPPFPVQSKAQERAFPDRFIPTIALRPSWLVSFAKE